MFYTDFPLYYQRKKPNQESLSFWRCILCLKKAGAYTSLNFFYMELFFHRTFCFFRSCWLVEIKKKYKINQFDKVLDLCNRKKRPEQESFFLSRSILLLKKAGEFTTECKHMKKCQVVITIIWIKPCISLYFQMSILNLSYSTKLSFKSLDEEMLCL